MLKLGNMITSNYGLNEKQKERLKIIKDGYEDLINLVDDSLLDGREKSLVITKLQEALMWTTRSIAVEPSSPFKNDVE